MKRVAEQVLCRFHLSNFVRHHDEPLYQWIVELAHREGLQGATVLKGIMGLRSDGSVLQETRWTIAQELPMIVEIVDGPKHLEALLARVEPVFTQGTITLERAHVMFYRGERDHPGGVVPPADVIASRGDSAAWEVKTMQLPEDGVLLRIFMGEADRETGSDRPLYEAIVRRAREAHLAGATVLKGPLGYGKNSRVHSAKLLELSTDLPIVIEIVDAEDKIRKFLPVVDELITEGMVTLEAVRVLKYVASPSGAKRLIQAGHTTDRL
jgi:PII-like signaling protein